MLNSATLLGENKQGATPVNSDANGHFDYSQPRFINWSFFNSPISNASYHVNYYENRDYGLPSFQDLCLSLSFCFNQPVTVANFAQKFLGFAYNQSDFFSQEILPTLAATLDNQLQGKPLASEVSGDCFFYSVAESLNALRHTQYTAKDIRKYCYEYIAELQNQSPGNNWIYQYFLEQAQNSSLGWANVEAKAIDLYFFYISNIQYTEKDIMDGLAGNLRAAIGGSEDFEGRIISEKFLVNLHVINIDHCDNIDEGKYRYILSERLNNRVFLNEYFPCSSSTLHLICYDKSYFPMLSVPNLEITAESFSQKSYYSTHNQAVFFKGRTPQPLDNEAVISEQHPNHTPSFFGGL